MQTLQIEIKNPPKFNNSLMQNPQIEAIPEIQNALIRNIQKPKPFKSKTPKLKTPEVQKLPNAKPPNHSHLQNPKPQKPNPPQIFSAYLPAIRISPKSCYLKCFEVILCN